MVQLPLTTLGQETRWAYSTPPPSPHGVCICKFVYYFQAVEKDNFKIWIAKDFLIIVVTVVT